MFNRTFLASIFIGVSTLITSHRVLAESADVEFNGIVAPVTSVVFIQQSPVKLGAGTNINTFEAIDPTIVRINTTTPVNVKVSAPNPVGFTEPQGTQYIGFLKYNGTEVQQETPVNITQIGNIDLGVRMKVVRPQAFSPGNYTYRVQLTIVTP